MVFFSSIKNDFFSDLHSYIINQNIKMRFNKKSKSELNLVSPDNLILDTIHRKILYDVYFSAYKKSWYVFMISFFFGCIIWYENTTCFVS